jgi:hypothetical protein
LDLVQILESRRELPRFVVENAVDDRRTRDANDAHGFRARAVGQRFLRRGRHGRAQQANGRQDPSRKSHWSSLVSQE